MKFRTLSLLLVAVFSLMMTTSNEAVAQATSGSSASAGETSPTVKPETVKPGNSSKTKNPSVQNNANKRGYKKLNQSEIEEQPEGASSGTFTVYPGEKVVANAGAHGEVSGLKDGQTVEVGNNTGVTISGDGGTVNMSGTSNSTTTISAGSSGNGISVSLPGGGSTTVPAGITQTFIYS